MPMKKALELKKISPKDENFNIVGNINRNISTNIMINTNNSSNEDESNITSESISNTDDDDIYKAQDTIDTDNDDETDDDDDTNGDDNTNNMKVLQDTVSPISNYSKYKQNITEECLGVKQYMNESIPPSKIQQSSLINNYHGSRQFPDILKNISLKISKDINKNNSVTNDINNNNLENCPESITSISTRTNNFDRESFIDSLHNSPTCEFTTSSKIKSKTKSISNIYNESTITINSSFNTSTTSGQINITKWKKKDKRTQYYKKELEKLQIEQVKLQAWIRTKGLKVVVIFEGRDAAGKGGVIKRIVERLNPRICRVVALTAPTEKEKTQWYFQRYIAHLPAAGEMVIFDRSWYNRVGVERVMDFCTEQEYQEFQYSCPIFEELLVKSGILLIKYWFSVSDDIQEKRFQDRVNNSIKRWKLSPIDIENRNRWVEYSKAKDEMLKYTDTDICPWIHVRADSKKLARLNCISHLLSMIPYQDLTPPAIILPPRKHYQGYIRPPLSSMKWVVEKYV